MEEISDFLECPDHCLPVTSMVVGWPAEAPAQRDRLPAEAWIHNERYEKPSADDIDTLYKDREVKGWNRYRSMGEEMVKRMDEHGITSLAQYYTSELKYAPDTFERDSQKLHALMARKGFMP